MVKLYYTRADAAEYYVRNAQSYLTKPRYERFCRLQNANDQLRCLASGLLLSKVYGKDSVEKMKLNEFGKPYIENGGYFNLSHSGNFVVLATGSKPVGVDIEQRKERGYEGIAHISFHEREQAFLKKSRDKEKTFYDIWTLKESYMKAVGRGFNLPPKNFYFDLSDGIRLCLQEERRNFYLNYGIEGYTVALCTQTDPYDGALNFIAL